MITVLKFKDAFEIYKGNNVFFVSFDWNFFDEILHMLGQYFENQEIVHEEIDCYYLECR